MHKLVIKENKTILLTSFVLFLCWSLVAGGEVWIAIKEDKPEQFVIVGILTAIAVLIDLFFLLKYWFWRLELSPYGCCYRNRFGKQREFRAQDVKQIGLRQKYLGLIKFNYLELMDQNGKIIVSINVLSAENVKYLIPFFEEYSTEVVIDPDGRIGVASRMPDLQDHVDPKSERKINHWREKQKKWDRKPAFYQNPVWMDRIRKMGWGLYVLAAGGLLASQLGSRTVAAIVYVVIPLILMIYFLIFHRVLVWRAPKQSTTDWENAHVVMPNFTLAILLFFFWCPLMGLNFSLDEQISFWGKLGALLLLLFLSFAIWQRAWGRIPGLILCIFIYSYIGSFCWNYLFTAEQESVRGEFTVLEKEETELVKFTLYHLLVYSEEEGEILFRVDADTYRRMEPQDSITFCIEESLFGVGYCYSEIPNDEK